MKLRLIYATLAGGVLSFLLGWLVFGLILMSFYTNNSIHYEGLMKPEPNLILIFLSCLVMSFFMAYVFDSWAWFKTFTKGLYGGFFIGIFIGLTCDLSFLAMMNLYSVKVMVLDVLVTGLMNAIIGGVIAWILGFEKKPTQVTA